MKIDWEKLKKKVGDINPVYTDEEVPTQRLKICSTCEHFEEVPARRCKECGCFLDVKVRTVRVTCPLMKW